MTPLEDNSKKFMARHRRSWKHFSWRKKSTPYAIKTSTIFCRQAFPSDNSKKRPTPSSSPKTGCTYRQIAPLSTPNDAKVLIRTDNSKKRAALPTSSKTVCTYRRIAPVGTHNDGKGTDSRG